MWACKKCREVIEDNFGACWKCGTSREGVEDPSFRKDENARAAATAPSSGETISDPADLDSQISKRFRCPKCRNRGASVKRIATTGTGLSRLFDVQHNRFIAASCSRCSYTELYNPELIEGKGVGMNILDFWFGG